MAQHTHDDAFREIQLNGKQLVFLFMVATVFSVVIFLCGVFVGRGVRAERPALIVDAPGSSPVTTPDVVASQEPVSMPAGSDPTAAAPPPAVDELSYFNRLDKSSAAVEDLKPAASTPAAVPATVPAAVKAVAEPAAPVARKEPAAVPTPKSPPATAASSSPTPPAASTSAAASASTSSAPEPAGSGFALQITALREKGEAESIAHRLSTKGYSAYVLTPSKGAPSVYRVRVGKFKTRREAEATATRLKKEEQFTPWITR